MTEIPVYLELTPEQQQALADNNVDIAAIVHTTDLAVTVTHGVLPYAAADGTRTKNVVPIILASAVLIPSIAMALAQVLQTILNRPQVVEYETLEPLRDGAGNPILDAYGQPQLHPVQRVVLLKPGQSSAATLESELSLTGGIRLRFHTEQSAAPAAAEEAESEA